MKKIIVIATFVLAIFMFASCTIKHNTKEETTNKETVYVATDTDLPDITAPVIEETTIQDTTAVTEVVKEYVVNNQAEAVQAAKDFLGEKDDELGYLYAFSFDAMLEDNGVSYYKVRVSWYLEEEERYSLCGYLLVDKNGNVSKYDW